MLKLCVVLLKKWLPVARFKGNVVATLHRSCMQTEQRPLKGGLMRQGCWYPPSFLVFLLSLCLSLSLSGSGVHVIGCFWFLVYYILWEVTIFGALEMFTPKGRRVVWCGGGGGTTTKILKIFHSESTRRLTSPPQSWETGKQYWYINHAAAVICWLHSRECDKVSFAGCCLLNSMVVFVVVISKQFFWRKTTELSLGLTREKQVVQLGALPPSCSSQACKRSSVGKGQCACVYACVVMYAFHIGPCAS